MTEFTITMSGRPAEDDPLVVTAKTWHHRDPFVVFTDDEGRTVFAVRADLVITIDGVGAKRQSSRVVVGPMF